MVFSHPNHEVAVLGTIFRLNPHIVYLTDGGADARVAETREALQNFEPASVHFLNHTEKSFYDALLGRDCHSTARSAEFAPSFGTSTATPSTAMR